jgi:hypothetical protein
MPTLNIAQELFDAVVEGEEVFTFIYADEFDAVDDEAAEALGKYLCFDLYLNGLTQLSDAVAEALSHGVFVKMRSRVKKRA